MTFSVTVENRGTGGAESPLMACYIDGEEFTSSASGEITAGSKITTTFTWKAKAGAHLFRAVIDRDKEIEESDETNNERSLAFSVTAPDLVVSAIIWSPVNPAAGDKITFTATVVNRGDERARNSHLEFFIDGSTRGQYLVPPIDPGDSVNVTYVWTAPFGRHPVKAAADVLGQVNESDETNNTKEVTFATALPDLTINLDNKVS